MRHCWFAISCVLWLGPWGNVHAVPQSRLVAFDGEPGDAFGVSVAIRGDLLVVGAPGDSTPEVFRRGSAYVFARSGNAWVQRAKLTGDQEDENAFGFSVAVGTNAVAIGAIGNRDLAGAVYIFEWVETNLVLKAKVTSDSLGQPYEALGYSTAISGNTILSGAPYVTTANLLEHGAAYVYVRRATNWALQAKLMAGDLPPVNPTGGSFYSEARFGWSVALDGNTAVVGAYRDDTPAGEDAGSVYVFVRQSTTWRQEAKVTPRDADDFDRFGASVAIDGNTILVGATQWYKPAGSNSGAAYVFTRTNGIWSEQAKLSVCDLSDQDFFGGEVVVRGNTAVVGAERKDTTAGDDAGVTYLFVREGTNWLRQDRVTSSDGVAWDLFGAALAYDGQRLLVGAPYEFNTWIDTGLAYVYDLTRRFGPEVFAASHPLGGVQLYATALPNCTYQFQRASTLPGQWTSFPEVIAPASGFIAYHDTNPPPTQVFYRCVQFNAAH
jgi:hypothetical protein